MYCESHHQHMEYPVVVSQLPDMTEYQARRTQVADLFRQLGRGSQQQASYATEISATLISLVLGGRYIDENKLGQLEEWAIQKLAERAVSDHSS